MSHKEKLEKAGLEIEIDLYGMSEKEVYAALVHGGFPPKEVLTMWAAESSRALDKIKMKGESGEDWAEEYDYIRQRNNRMKYALELCINLVIDLEQGLIN